MERLQYVVDASELSQAKFGESLKRPGYPGENQQTIQRYLSGGLDISEKVAREIVRVYGGRVSYLMGLDDIPTEMDETALRMSAWRDKSDKSQTAFALLASLMGWEIEETPPLAAPFACDERYPHDDEGFFDTTPYAMYQFHNFATITRYGKSRTLNRVEFDRFMDKMARYFDFELENTRFEADSDEQD